MTRFLALAVGLGGMVGCGLSKPEENLKEPPRAGDAMTAVYNEIERLKQFDMTLMKVFQDMDRNLKSRIESLEEQVRDLQEAVNILMGELKAMKGETSPTEPRPNPQPDVKPPPKDPAAILAEVARQMRAIKLDREGVDQVRTQLRAVGENAVPYFLTELRQTPSHENLVPNFVEVMAGFPPQELESHFASALQEGRLRGTIAETIGRSGSPQLGRLLKEYINTPDEFFRAQVAEALARCKQEDGIVLLLIMLSHSEFAYRQIAISTLGSIVGKRFGFDPGLGPDSPSNKAAIEEFKAWYKAREGKVFADK